MVCPFEYILELRAKAPGFIVVLAQGNGEEGRLLRASPCIPMPFKCFVIHIGSIASIFVFLILPIHYFLRLRNVVDIAEGNDVPVVISPSS